MSKYKILYIFIFLFIILKMIILCENNTILIRDDLNFAYMQSAYYENANMSQMSLWDLCISQFSDLFDRYHCGLLAHFLTKLNHLIIPFLLKIHPTDFLLTPMSIIKGSIFFLLISLIGDFSQIYIKKEKLKVSIIIALSFLLFNLAKCNGLDIFTINVNFYSYTLGLLFYCILMHLIIKNIIRNKKTKKIEFCLSVLCAILLANASTFISFITLISLLLIITYNIFIFLLQKRMFIKKETYEKIKFNLNKNFFIPAITFSITFFYMWNYTNIYKLALTGRVINENKFNLTKILEYANVLYNEYGFLLIYFIILIVLVPLLIKRKLLRIKIINFSLILQLTIITILVGLFFSGEINDTKIYWVQMSTIKNIITLIFIGNILLLLNNFIYLVRSWKARKFIVLSIFIIFTTTFSFVFLKEIINLKRTSQELKYNNHLLAIRYIEEKMLRFYFLRNETPILPREELSAEIIYEPCYKNKICVKNHFMAKRYYPIVYRDTSSMDKELCFYEDAYEQFHKKGGRIYEFEIDDINFSRLFDENFVLNRNTEINYIKKLYENPSI